MSKLENFLGGSPLSVLGRLLIISLIVGVIMAAFNWTPYSLFADIVGFFRDLWELGFQALGRFGTYLVLGASVVVPLFILSRIFSRRK